ncbi:MAG: hypothetical protein HYV77_01505 [Candidatus Wildermuthbacteria bacterium]|nr:hypothetical protein [Candidatus Wildermuthbacteria bacterium]
MHTYIGFRVAIGAVALMLVCWLVIAAYQGWFKKYLLAAAIFILGFFITAGPMIWYFSENPEDFIGRASGVSITNQPEPLVALSKSFAAHLGMFNIYGDPNSRHNIPGAPMLAYPVGFLFLIGWWYALSKVFVSLWRIVSNRTKASIKEHGFPLVFYGMFFVWFFAFLAPGFLTYEGIPHALRVLGIIPVVYLLAGLGGYLFFAWLRQFFAKWPVMTALLKIGSVGLLLILVATTWYQYFYKWGANPEMHNAFTTRFADVGKTLNSFPEKTPKYVIMSEGDLPVESTRFVQKTAGRQEAIYITREEARTRSFSSGDLIFTMNKEYEDVSALVQKYPQGETVEFERFWMFKVR